MKLFTGVPKTPWYTAYHMHRHQRPVDLLADIPGQSLCIVYYVYIYAPESCGFPSRHPSQTPVHYISNICK